MTEKSLKIHTVFQQPNLKNFDDSFHIGIYFWPLKMGQNGFL